MSRSLLYSSSLRAWEFARRQPKESFFEGSPPTASTGETLLDWQTLWVMHKRVARPESAKGVVRAISAEGGTDFRPLVVCHRISHDPAECRCGEAVRGKHALPLAPAAHRQSAEPRLLQSWGTIGRQSVLPDYLHLNTASLQMLHYRAGCIPRVVAAGVSGIGAALTPLSHNRTGAAT